MTDMDALKTQFQDIERRLEIVELVLDIDPGAFEKCQANRDKCGDGCTEEGCPLTNNQVHRIGSVVVSFIEESRWQRAWAEEMEYLRVVPSGTQERVALRVRLSQHTDAIRDAEALLGTVENVPDMLDKVQSRIKELRGEVARINKELEP